MKNKEAPTTDDGSADREAEDRNLVRMAWEAM
jgi:hypothetical protein